MSNRSEKREHGGNLDAAIARFGGLPDEWLDLSTGINPVAYPIPALPARAWRDLPTASDMQRLANAAADAYGTEADIIPFGGAQGAIQAVPYLADRGDAAVVAPTYNEHAATLRASGWAVREVASLSEACGADLAVVVNPNNPDGRHWTADEVSEFASSVGILVVDESFADPDPANSLAPNLPQVSNALVLRSFGKFYGLAGVRLGFALATNTLSTRLAAIAGPWPVSGPAIHIAAAAFADRTWQTQTIERLVLDAQRLDALVENAGWRLVGGTALFRTYETPGALDAQAQLATHKVWSRAFSYSDRWIRLGLPHPSGWPQLARAFP